MENRGDALKICILDHHNKAQGIETVLRCNDFEIADPYSFDYEAVLVDTDHPGSPPPDKPIVLQECARRGIPIILYPHGGPPDLDYDGLRKLTLPISLRLVHGEGHAEIARRYGCKHRVEVVGWSFCEMAGLTAETPAAQSAVSQLLFAPIHPWADGQGILPFHKSANVAAYHVFLEHPAEHKTVRMYGADDPNGITERVDGIEYTQTDLGSAVDVVDAHDAVISFGTLAYTALARGKPVAMIFPYPGFTDDRGNFRTRHFEAYQEYCAYPASVGMAPLDELFSRDVTDWKRLFVGEP